jgi:hypothetical protein
MKNPLTYQIIDKKNRLIKKMRQNFWKKSAKTWMCACCQIDPKTHNIYSLHGSLVECQIPASGGGLFKPRQYDYI